VTTGITIDIWDITGSDPQLLETFTGYSYSITSLAFSSPTSLISVSYDHSVRFWKIGASSTNPALASPKSIPLASAPIKSITLQAKDGITISSHSDGMVRIWDILTGLCKASFQTPAKDTHWMDTQLAESRLISVWCTDEKIYIWDTEKEKLLRTVDISGDVIDLRMSVDGSVIFCLYQNFVQAWSIWTGEAVGKAIYGSAVRTPNFLTIDGQTVWFQVYSGVASTVTMGWNFGSLDSSSIELSGSCRNGPRLDFIGGIRIDRSFLPGIQDTVTRKVVLQLPGRLTRPSDAQWDGQYLVVGYDSGEVLILECNHVPH